MTNRYPLVVNATTNQITEVQSGDNLLLDNTDLTTSSGDLVLDPAGDVDIKADLKNTVDPNLKIDDDLYVTGTVGIGVAPSSGIDIKIERTWNNSLATFFGTNIDITPTNYNTGSRLFRLANTSVTKFDVDVDGNTNIYGTTTLHGNATFISDAFFGDGDTINLGTGNDLQINHDGIDSYIVDSTRHLLVRANGSGNLFAQSNQSVVISNIGDTATYAEFNNSGSVDLYYNNNQKLQTTNTGISVTGNGVFSGNISGVDLTGTGNLTVDGNSTLGDANTDDCAINARITTSLVPKTDSNDDLGTTALRWADLFVDDITVTTGVSVGTLKSQNGTTALTLANTTGDVTVAGDLTVTGNDIKSSSGTPITLSGNDVTINGNLTVDGTQTILNTTTLSVEDATIELRRGNSLSAATGGIQVNQTTDGTGAVLTYQSLLWDSTATKWRTYDGTTYKSLVNETDATTLGKITLNGGVVENFDDASTVGAGGTITLDQNSSNVHFHTNPAGDYTFRVNNVPTTNNYVTTVMLVVEQGATPGIPTSLNIDGTTQTFKIQSGGTFIASPNSGDVDVFTFSLYRRAGSWTVLANQTKF